MKQEILDLEFQILENRHSSDVIQQLKDEGYIITSISDVSDPKISHIRLTKIEFYK